MYILNLIGLQHLLLILFQSRKRESNYLVNNLECSCKDYNNREWDSLPIKSYEIKLMLAVFKRLHFD